MLKQNIKTDIVHMLSIGCICALGSIVIEIILVALAAVFIQNEYLNIGSSDIPVLLVQLIAAVVGVAISGKVNKTSPLMQCLLTGTCCIVLQFLIAMLFFDGVGVRILMNLIAAFVGCGIAIILCLKPNKVGNRRKRRTRFR